ncbi:Rap1a/Tai family immunity protein [Methylobacterium fujisawaense]|uniref:Rap1a/Tai family immunity protein n=1 Tax=Methylobacterium fujisawaense TaxID=107400 RepID=UPI00313C75EC
MRGRRILGVAMLAGFAAAGAPPALAADGGTAHAPTEAPVDEPIRQGPVDVTRRRTQDLYLACLAEQGAASGWCSAYLMGVADTLTAFGNGGDRGGLCNVDYSIEQLSETFLTWARAHDAMLQLDMLAGVTIAFRRRWPCR